MTLAVVSALVVQSVRAVSRADLGYNPSRLIAAQIDIPEWKVAGDDEALRLRQRLIERARAIPGVEAATLATEIPSLHFASPTGFEIVGRPVTEDRDRPSAGLTVTSADYFRVTGIPVIAGRGFEAADQSSPTAVAVVSAETARRYFTRRHRGAGRGHPAAGDRRAARARRHHHRRGPRHRKPRSRSGDRSDAVPARRAPAGPRHAHHPQRRGARTPGCRSAAGDSRRRSGPARHRSSAR